MAYTRKRKQYRTMSKTPTRFTSASNHSIKSRFNKYKRRRTGGGMAQKVSAIWKTIETKEGSQRTNANIALAHNNTYVLQDSLGGGDINPLATGNGTADPMAGLGQRVGDQITLRGLRVVFFLENALARPKVYYRLMLLKCYRGATFDRANIFKGDSNNKMIDQLNTEKFTVVWQRVVTVTATNGEANAVSAAGEPSGSGGTIGGIGTRIVRAWIPGVKFGKGGRVSYENGSTVPKFFDYRFVVLAYDWYGTPQDVNNVGRINEMYVKQYYKDA